MGIFLNTIKNNINLILKKGIITPLLFAIVILAVIAVIYYIKKREVIFKTYKRTCVFAFLTAYFFAFAVELTLVVRAGYECNPLSKLWSGWLIVKQTYVYDLSPVGNILLIMPFAVSLMLLFDSIKNYSVKKKLALCTLASFLVSLLIESSQLVFRIGTFQISDLFYNTLGGLISALIYIAIKNKVAQRR